jgi:quinol monooxygenase YgiN
MEFVQMVGKREGGTALYRSLQDVEDPTRFTHYMVFNTAAAEANHQKTAWVKAFVEKLHPLCSEPPVFTEVHVVGEGSR